MKKILCVALVLMSSFVASAQEKTIDGYEFEIAKRNSFSGLGDKPHRVINTNEFSAEGVFDGKNLTKVITEFLPGKFHYIFASPSIKNEKIRIGDKTYTREGNGEWKLEFKQVKFNPESVLTIDETQAEYKFLGTERIGNQSVCVYAKIERSKRINPKNNRETLSTSTTKYWFGDESWYWKSETNTEFLTGDRKSYARSTMVYELDPNIKIEAPILNLVN